MAALILQYNVDIVDVKASGSHISGNENGLVVRFAECANVVLSFGLGNVAVEGDEASVGHCGERDAISFGFTEDDHFFVSVLLYVVLNHNMLLLSVSRHHADVLDRVRNLVGRSSNQVDKNRVLKLFSRDVLNVRRNGSRENHGLSTGHILLQRLNILIKAHVQHLVALVKHLVLALTNLEAVVFAQVDKATGRCDHNLGLFVSDLTH